MEQINVEQAIQIINAVIKALDNTEVKGRQNIGNIMGSIQALETLRSSLSGDLSSDNEENK